MFRRLPVATLLGLSVAMFTRGEPVHAGSMGADAPGSGVTIASDGALLASAEPLVLASAYVRVPRYEATAFRPKRSGGSGPHVHGMTQLHAGFLQPEHSGDPGFVLGFRAGQQIDDIVQLGIGLDWRNRSGRTTLVLEETTGPGGEPILVGRDLSRYSSNLFPTLLYLQLSGPASMRIIPYLGVAGSWQVLFLSADDSQTGATFDGTYDGFGWQLWAGAALPTSGRARLVAEVFMNQADLERDVYDPMSGYVLRQVVSTDGIGARFGVSWGF